MQTQQGSAPDPLPAPSSREMAAAGGRARPGRHTVGLVVVGSLLGLLAVVGGMLLSNSGRLTGSQSPGAGGNVQIVAGAAVPDFQATDLAGQPVQLSALRGQPVWINFWATWCLPCKTEMPLMEQKYQQYQGQGLVILGINLQESPAAVQTWVQDRFHWRFLLDPQGKLADLYNLEGVPTHLFIDRAGLVRSVQIGTLDAAQMEARLQPILTP